MPENIKTDPQFIQPGVVEEIPEFYSKPCVHLNVLKDCFETFNLAVQSYEFNCRDCWICRECNCRVDPHTLLKKENYEIV